MNFPFNDTTLTIVITEYWDGNMAVMIGEAHTGLPYGTISVNLPESKALPKGTFFIKDWSENREIVHTMYALGILQRVPNMAPVTSGFITAYAGRIVA